MLIAIYHLELTKAARDKINAGKLKHIHELYLNAGHFGSNEVRKQIWEASKRFHPADNSIAEYLSYKHVADIVVSEVEIEPALYRAFEVTQNVTRNWTENYMHVKWLGDKHARSSSVGDIFLVGGVCHVVEPLTLANTI